MKLITTSWDDGHPKDFKLAELLDKYNLPATFYIPKENAEHEVMKEEEIAELAKKFEIGGHTLHHRRLTELDEVSIEKEVKGCFIWLSKLLNLAPQSFCLPGGKFNAASISIIMSQGFKIIRTTELFSLKTSLKKDVIPTTLQVFEHSSYVYAKHLVKRKRFGTLVTWMKNGASTDLLKLVDEKLKQIDDSEGCFHLWGHSWEIDQYDLWKKLELIFAHLSRLSGFEYIQNKQLIKFQ